MHELRVVAAAQRAASKTESNIERSTFFDRVCTAKATIAKAMNELDPGDGSAPQAPGPHQTRAVRRRQLAQLIIESENEIAASVVELREKTGGDVMVDGLECRQYDAPIHGVDGIETASKLPKPSGL